VALLLACFAVFQTRFRDRWFFFGLGVFATLYGLGAHTPLFRLFYHVVPNVKQLRAPSMIMFQYVFAIALCAGAGLDALLRPGEDRKKYASSRLLWIIAAVLGGVTLLLTIAPSGMLGIYRSVVYSDIAAAKAAVLDAHTNTIVIGFWVATLLALGTAYLSGRLLRTGAAWVLAGIALLVVIDTVRMDRKFIQSVDLNRYFPDDPVIEFLKSRPEPVRVLPFPGGFRTNYFALKGIAEVGGYHGNQLRTYNDFLGGSDQPRMAMRPALDVDAVNYLVFRRGANLQDDPADPTVEKVYDQNNIVVFHNLAALPRARLVTCWQQRAAGDSLVEGLFQPDFDYRNCVLVEEPLPFASRADSLSPGSAAITHYGLEEVDVEVQATDSALLVLADNYYHDWHVQVDEVDTRLRRVNATFRGVVVPPGEHRVRFYYHSERLAAGAWISLLSALLAAAVIAAGALPLRRREP
jgi:hypothetical protein